MTLKNKIIGVVGVVAALLLMLFAGSTYLTAELQAAIMQREANDVPSKAVLHFRYHVSQVQQFITDAGATGDRGSIDEATAHLEAGNKQLDIIEASLPAEAERIALLKKRFREFYDEGLKMADAYIQGGREAGNQIMKMPDTGFDARAAALVESLDPLMTQLEATNAQLQQEEFATEQRSHVLLLAAEALILIVVIAALAWLGKDIWRRIGGEPAYAVEVAHRIAGGDLVSPVAVASGDDSLLGAMRQMQSDIRQTVLQIIRDAEGVAATAAQLVAGSGNVAEGSRRQSASASAMAAAVEEMTVSVGQIADNASEAREAARHSGALSEQGEVVVDSAVQEMRNIASSVNESSKIIADLDAHSRQIADIVNVIREIADQTNLLALNAAIEAARAGEQGRGFAVVADEVRKLAERTSQSTHEISGMIGRIQQGTQSAVESMRQGVDMANEGMAMATKAGESIVEIKMEASRSASIVGDISDSIKEQSAATQEIAGNVERIAQMSEANSIEAGRSAEAAQQMLRLAETLKEHVSRFRIA